MNRRLAIFHITQNRVTNMCAMYSDLMSSTGFNKYLQPTTIFGIPKSLRAFMTRRKKRWCSCATPKAMKTAPPWRSAASWALKTTTKKTRTAACVSSMPCSSKPACPRACTKPCNAPTGGPPPQTARNGRCKRWTSRHKKAKKSPSKWPLAHKCASAANPC